jgi:hypothetical protein
LTWHRGTLVLIVPLAEANALLEEPLAVAVGLGNAFVICPHCADILSRDLDELAALCTQTSRTGAP